MVVQKVLQEVKHLLLYTAYLALFSIAWNITFGM